MKRIGFLIEKIAEMENLRLAFWKTKRAAASGSIPQGCPSVNTESFLTELRDEILTANVNVGNYYYFKIYDPKERLICAASFRERVLHHAIMNVCHQFFEKFQINDSYATRTGKGQYAALNRVKQWIVQEAYPAMSIPNSVTLQHNNLPCNLYFLKLDVRKYFDSINHRILFEKLSRKFKDPYLLKLFWEIINSYSVTELRGVPIGNLTSQYFGNFYLAHLDHYIEELSSSVKYVRYMDDMVFIHKNKSVLLDIYKKVEAYCREKLDLQLKAPVLNSIDRGIPFLGYVLFSNNVRLNKSSKKRFIMKAENYGKQLSNGLWSQKEYARHVEPLVAFTRFANTVELRRKVFTEFKQRKPA
ncbi:MAG: RNA-directed DNA polymerase [Chitinispirillales bacterium]|jgi:hypothetical protein|nr:RNA-directed DNA polymerase [Chitinispirillales bacterium]